MLDRPGAEAAPSPPTSTRKLEAAKQDARRLPGGAAGRDPGRPSRRGSRSTSRPAYDLELRRRGARSSTSAPLADKLDARRLRGVMMRWKRHLEATADGRTTRSSAPGTPSPRCRSDEFAARAAEVHASLTQRRGREGRADPSAGRPGRARRQPAGEHGRGRRAVRRPVRPARGAAEEQDAEAGQAAPAAAPSPSGSRSARRSIGPDGPLAISADDRRGCSSTRRSGSSSSELNGAIERAECDASGGPGAGDGPERRAPAGRAARLPPRQPGPAGQGGPAAVPPGARRARAAAVPQGERPARAGPGDRRRPRTR